jgi:hypothetical protein
MQKLTEVYRHGSNPLAAAFVLIAALVATAAWFPVSWQFGDTLFSQMVAFGIGGVAMIICDLIYRARQRDTAALLRFVSPVAGGSILLLPSWILGIGTIAVATYIYLSEPLR